MRLQGKAAIVTGGARGIGAGIARCLAAEGSRIGIIDLDGPEAQATAARLGVEAVGLAADVSQEGEAKAATEEIVRELGRLDILVNNAGGGGPNFMTSVGNPFTNVDQTGWEDALAANLRTTFAMTKAGIPHLEKAGAGSIVNIASIAGLIPSVLIPAYGAAKAGVISLTRTLALELAPRNIRVNAICPGFLWTRAWETMATGLKFSVSQFADMEPRDIFLEVVRRGTPLGREQTPEDIGKLTLFLASDDAVNVTGQIISVDGGITLKYAAS
ncbi:MAG: SDR family oxidoreductase [bacterium]